MALDTALYLVTKDIAIRSGMIESRYRIADGRFVLDSKDLSRVRFTSDEYVTGLHGVEKVTQDVARSLIAQNGFTIGLEPSVKNVDVSTNEEPQEPQDVNEENVVVDEPVDEPNGDEPHEEETVSDENEEPVVDGGDESESANEESNDEPTEENEETETETEETNEQENEEE